MNYADRKEVEQVLEDSGEFNFDCEYCKGTKEFCEKCWGKGTFKGKYITTNERWEFLKKAGVQVVWCGEGNEWTVIGQATGGWVKTHQNKFGIDVELWAFHAKELYNFEGIPEHDRELAELAACCWVVLNEEG